MEDYRGLATPLTVSRRFSLFQTRLRFDQTNKNWAVGTVVLCLSLVGYILKLLKTERRQLIPFFKKNVELESKIQLQNLLESVCKTDNIDSLNIVFCSLGFYMMSNPQHTDMIIKFKPLYDKILLVLCEGLPTKIKLTLNLISALMFIQPDEVQNRKITLRLYAQNMIRISGCLSALANMFTSCMMQHETWNALCHSLSEACHNCALSQNYCTHLVPLCIQRCRRPTPEVLMVLQSLLVNHEKNIKVFYEFEGMSIFSRETLLYTIYLQTLNTVIENTKPTHKEHIANAKIIFQYLRGWLLEDDGASSVTEWAAVVLYSRRKLLGNDDLMIKQSIMEDKDDLNSVHEHQEHQQQDETRDSNENNSETRDLFQNVFKEVIAWNTHNISNLITGRGSERNIAKHSISSLPQRAIRNPIEKPMFPFNPNPIKHNRKPYRKTENINNNFQHTNLSKGDRDLSFSFLLNQNRERTNETKTNGSYVSKVSRYKHDVTNRQTIDINTLTKASDCTLKEYKPEETGLVGFRPHFASTPKTLKRHNRSKQYSNKYRSFKRKEIKRHSPRKSDIKNSSMSAKFMEILNGSCTTLIRSIYKLKSVFIPKAKDTVSDTCKITQTDIGSLSFTNYMKERDAFGAIDKEKDNTTKLSRSSNTTISCRTCNDTIVLKHKLAKDPSLKECVKTLKLGINLYGCDFKKISRMFWSREPYMTPEVLYSLYRKLIAK